MDGLDKMSIPVQRCYPEEYLTHEVADMQYGTGVFSIKIYSIRFRNDCNLEMFPNACNLLSFSLADDGRVAVELIGRITELMAPRQHAGRVYTMLRFPPYFTFHTLGNMNNQTVALSPEIFGGEASIRRAVTAPSAQMRFDLLMRLVADSGLGLVENPVVSEFLMQCLRADSLESIETIIEKMNYSPRYVRGVIKQTVGVNAKRLADIIRLQRIINMLIFNDEDPITCVCRNGFYDQTHMNKNLKKLTECSYTSFRTILRRKNVLDEPTQRKGDGS